jgi:hypothetical protein
VTIAARWTDAGRQLDYTSDWLFRAVHLKHARGDTLVVRNVTMPFHPVTFVHDGWAVRSLRALLWDGGRRPNGNIDAIEYGMSPGDLHV